MDHRISLGRTLAHPASLHPAAVPAQERPTNAGVLVLVDAPTPDDAAAWRGAFVARELALPLRLLRVQGTGTARLREAEALQALAGRIRRELGVPVQADCIAGDGLAVAVQAARTAALLVIGSRRGNPLRELVLGTQAERLIRLCKVPVLVVKRPPAGAYRRVLAPVELGPSARDVIAAAARLSRDPRMEVLHALHPGEEAGMRACELPEWVTRRERRRAAARALAALRALVRQATTPAAQPATSVLFGDAAALVLAREQAMAAELVVIGKRTRWLLADFLLGSVTQRVLARSRADVLVLPVVRVSRAGDRAIDTERWSGIQLS